MLKVFGDESHDSKTERVFAIAIVFGTEAQWAELEAPWKERLAGRIFHATDCETDRGEFAATEHRDNLKLFADLTTILCKSALRGFGAAMDLGGHQQFFPDVPAEVPYYRCFRDVVIACGERAIEANEVAEFYFDQRTETDFNAGVLLGHMATTTQWEYSKFLNGRLNVVSRSCVGIQVADLLARETMKHLDNRVLGSPRPTRRSLTAIVDTGRFKFDLYEKEFFEDYKRKFAEIQASSGMSFEGYNAWLNKHRQMDSMSSRHQYLIDFDNGIA